MSSFIPGEGAEDVAWSLLWLITARVDHGAHYDEDDLLACSKATADSDVR